MTPQEHPPVRVLYFAGSGRSGTTVVSNILGQLPGAFAAGELRYLWQRGVEQDHLCGCGQPFSACPVWTAVMARLRADAGSERDEPAIGRRLLGRLRMARLPGALLRDALGRRALPAHPDDIAVTDLYRAIADQTGADLVIDGSKLPPYGLLLRQQPGIDLYVLHLVRDPRATAFSWLRSKPTRDTAVGAQMQRQETWKSSVLWTVWNLTALRLWRDGDQRVCRVRYEDLIADPVGQLGRVAAMVGADPADLPFLAPDRVQLAPTHSVAGNPNRHDTGEITLRADDQWRTAMSRRDRAVVTLLTAPGLRRFRYPLDTRTPPRPRTVRRVVSRSATSAGRAR
ncbi:sulfotransferase [Phycicoccus sp. Soil748]|uniref:sulfotransferase n=1 Tax=Phycicoccus sp. Soil748 TaxID=1736397 RepID=UPI000703383B|nr:sulfotransferase [Phycicoccus sp. Soil748]KRE58811.1 hypothetical protein ASG70_16295 [Phycicoccus sp. Soil748]